MIHRQFEVQLVIGVTAMTTKTLTYTISWEKELTLTKKDISILKVTFKVAFEITKFVLDLI